MYVHKLAYIYSRWPSTNFESNTCIRINVYMYTYEYIYVYMLCVSCFHSCWTVADLGSAIRVYIHINIHIDTLIYTYICGWAFTLAGRPLTLDLKGVSGSWIPNTGVYADIYIYIHAGDFTSARHSRSWIPNMCL